MPKLKRSDIIILAIMILVVGGLGFGVYHYLGQVAKATAQRQEKEQQLQAIKQKILRFAKLRDQVAENEAAMQRLADYIPGQEGQAEFIMELDELSRLSGVKLQNCSVNEQPVPFPNLPEYVIYQWTVSLKSDYAQLMKFLEVLPDGKRSAMVSKINITSATPEAGDKSRAKYSLTAQLTLDLISTGGQKKVIQ